MNLRPDILSITLLFLSVLCATNCSADASNEKVRISLLCEQAKDGTLEISQIDTSSAYTNAYLYDCSVAVVISDPIKVSGESGSRAKRDLKKTKRTQIADFLLTHELDLNYKNQHGNSMLIATVISFLPIEWKKMAVKKLIAKGINVYEKNNGGKTALDLAESKNFSNILQTLSKSMKKQ